MFNKQLTSTKYEGISDDELLKMLGTASFRALDLASKKQLLQEFENREADAAGRERCEVAFEKTDPGTLGYFSPAQNRIVISKSMLESKFNSTGASDLIETLIHEGRHAFQYHMVKSNDKRVDDKTRFLWRMGFQVYLGGKSGFAYYAAEAIEMDARREAREKVASISEKLSKLTGQVDLGWNRTSRKLIQREIDTLNIMKKCKPDEVEILEGIIRKIVEKNKQELERLFPDLDFNDFKYFYAIAEVLSSERKPDESTVKKLDCMYKPDIPGLHFFVEKADKTLKVDQFSEGFKAASRFF